MTKKSTFENSCKFERGKLYGSTGNPDYIYRVKQLGKKMTLVETVSKWDHTPCALGRPIRLPTTRAKQLFFRLP